MRLPLNLGDSDHFACLGAVTSRSWLTDLGVPVVVSEQVYREFDRARSNHTVAVEADLRGRVVIGGIPDPFTHVPLTASTGASSAGIEALLRRSTELPVAYIHVTTPLDCDFRSNDSHPTCNAWTLFKCTGSDVVASEQPDAATMLAGVGSFGVTYTGFHPDSPNDIDRAVQFLKASPRWLHVTRINRFFDRRQEDPFTALASAWSNVEIQLLTDFDGLVPRLSEAVFNLCSPPSRQAQSASFFIPRRIWQHSTLAYPVSREL